MEKFDMERDFDGYIIGFKFIWIRVLYLLFRMNEYEIII